MKNKEHNTIVCKSPTIEAQIKKAKKRKEERLRQARENLASVGITNEAMKAGQERGESAMETIQKIAKQRAKTHPIPPRFITPAEQDLDDIIDELFHKSDLLKEKNKEIEQLKNRVKELEAKLAESTSKSNSKKAY